MMVSVPDAVCDWSFGDEATSPLAEMSVAAISTLVVAVTVIVPPVNACVTGAEKTRVRMREPLFTSASLVYVLPLAQGVASQTVKVVAAPVSAAIVKMIVLPVATVAV